MPISFNGNSPQSITFNGNQVDKVVYNGQEVWNRAYTITYSNLNSVYGYITYKGSKKTGSGSFKVNPGDSISCTAGVNTGSSYIYGTANIYLNGSRVATKSVSNYNNYGTTSYTYYPSSNSSISYQSSTTGSSITTNVRITT